VEIPEALHYAENHEWVRREDDGSLTVGISDYAQDALGDIVFVELPDVGRAVAAGEAFGEVESTKSVSDVYAPTAGTVMTVNEALDATPELVNQDPYGSGWFITLVPAPETSLEGLMDAAAYAEYTKE